MKTIRILGFLCLLMGTALWAKSAMAVQLAVQSGVATLDETVSLVVTVDVSTQIAGAAFTLEYNTDDLQLVSVTQTFFGGFLKGEEVGGSGTMVSGARAQTGASTSTLMTLHFHVKPSATGDYPIRLSASTIQNAPAGYSVPAAVPILVGADPGRPATDPAAYPMLPVTTVSGTLSIDRDEDGLTDTEEVALGTDMNHWDSDRDGLPDGYEMAHGLLPKVNDALLDKDGDGFGNLREYLAGSDPDDDQDVPQTLLADPDGDLDVDGTELSGLAEEFGREDCDVPPPCEFDLNGDGKVDEVDLSLFVEEFGW